MKILSKKTKTFILTFLFITSTCASVCAVETPKDRINHWIKEYPYIGLIAKEVSHGPITLKNFELESKSRIVIAKPGELINGTLNYEVAKDQLKSLHLHHIIIGIEDQDAQSCITHALGVWDSEGDAKFSFLAPIEKGVYEVRFDYQTALTCNEACKLWRKNPPNSKATVGIVIVE